MGQASMNMEMMIAMPRILYSMMDVNLNSIVQVHEKLWNYSNDMDDSHTFKIKISIVFFFFARLLIHLKRREYTLHFEREGSMPFP